MRAIVTIGVVISLVIGGWFVGSKIMDSVKSSQARNHQMMLELSK